MSDPFAIMLNQEGIDKYENQSYASRVAWSLRLTFTEHRKTETLTEVRLNMLESTMYLCGQMSHVADQLYKPFGPAECGLLSDADYDRNTLPSVSDTPKRIVRGLEQTRGAICDGTYVAGVSSLDDVVEACKSFKFPTGLECLTHSSTTTNPTGDGQWKTTVNGTQPNPDVETIAHAQYEAIKNNLAEHGWTGRQELHEQIVENTVGNLRAKYGDWYTFYALTFLPYNQESQKCVDSIPSPDGGKLIDASQTNLNYFVRYVPKVADSAESRSKLNSTWETIESQRSSILGNVFGSNSEKLCKRLARAVYDTAGLNLEADSGVGAFAAIKCGDHFVWYQLAYAYFPAARTNSPYKFTSEGNKYDANCGQLILFP